MENKGDLNKVSFARTIMQAFELQRLAKKHSEEIKPIALTVIELRLSEGISQIVSQSVEKSRSVE